MDRLPCDSEHDALRLNVEIATLHCWFELSAPKLMPFPCYHSRKSCARRLTYATCATHSFAGHSPRRYLDASAREFRTSSDERIRDERSHFRKGNRLDRIRFERVRNSRLRDSLR